ncbi:uncharacterized protein RG961_003481 isoform 1-T3 [Leptosomus discolor]
MEPCFFSPPFFTACCVVPETQRGSRQSLGGAKLCTDQRPEEARRMSAGLASESGASCSSLVKRFCSVVQVLSSCLWSWVPQAMMAAASNTGIGVEQLSGRPRSF